MRIILFLGEFSDEIKFILWFNYSNIIFSELISKLYFDKLYDKYINIPKWWKIRDDFWKDELFNNFKIIKSWEQYLWWFSIKKYKDWYLIECLYSEIEWIWISSFIINEFKNSNTNIYAFSKNEYFYWFKKLEETSETWASLFILLWK